MPVRVPQGTAPDDAMSPPAHDPCGHDPPPPPPAPGAVGIPRSGAFDASAFEKAVGDLLRACGIAPDNAHTGRTAQRVRELWQRRLLGGYELDPAEVLGDGFEDARRDMVVIRGIAVHGVCPHHLVPFRGVAHVPPTCPAGACTDSGASRAWSTPSATASPTRNG
jgi:GTP cyclohydrolase I (EC 3.5.4.16)